MFTSNITKQAITKKQYDDAETRFTTNNVSVTTFSLATTHSYKGKDGNWVNETTWHNIVSFGLSDYFKESLRKGKKFYVEGRLSKRNYEDKDGIKRYSTEVITEKLIPLEARDDSAQHENSNSNDSTNSADEDNDLPF